MYLSHQLRHQGTTIRNCKWTSRRKSVLSESADVKQLYDNSKRLLQKEVQENCLPIPLIWKSTSNSKGTLTEIDLLTAW